MEIARDDSIDCTDGLGREPEQGLTSARRADFRGDREPEAEDEMDLMQDLKRLGQLTMRLSTRVGPARAPRGPDPALAAWLMPRMDFQCSQHVLVAS